MRPKDSENIICNADGSSAAAIDSVDSFLVAIGAVVTTAGRGHKNESTDPKSVLLSTLPLPLSQVEVPPRRCANSPGAVWISTDIHDKVIT